MDVTVGVFTRIKRALPIKDATLGADLQTKDQDQTTGQDQGSQIHVAKFSNFTRDKKRCFAEWKSCTMAPQRISAPSYRTCFLPLKGGIGQWGTGAQAGSFSGSALNGGDNFSIGHAFSGDSLATLNLPPQSPTTLMKCSRKFGGRCGTCKNLSRWQWRPGTRQCFNCFFHHCCQSALQNPCPCHVLTGCFFVQLLWNFGCGGQYNWKMRRRRSVPLWNLVVQKCCQGNVFYFGRKWGERCSKTCLSLMSFDPGRHWPDRLKRSVFGRRSSPLGPWPTVGCSAKRSYSVGHWPMAKLFSVMARSPAPYGSRLCKRLTKVRPMAFLTCQTSLTTIHWADVLVSSRMTRSGAWTVFSWSGINAAAQMPEAAHTGCGCRDDVCGDG